MHSRAVKNQIRAALAFGAGAPGDVVAGGVNEPRRCGRHSPCKLWLFRKPNHFTKQVKGLFAVTASAA